VRIGIDARWIFPQVSGIGAYTRALIRELAAMETPHAWILLFNTPALRDRLLETLGPHAGRVEPVLVPWGLFSPGNQLRAPGLLKRLRLDVFHSPNYMIPLLAFPRGRCGRPAGVVTIHDVIPMLFPHHAPRSRKSRLYPLYRRLMIEIGRRADAILADSDCSRRDILAHLRIPPGRAGRVRTIPCGVDRAFFELERVPESARDPQRPRRVLYVGRMDPYKNVATLLRAVAHARAAGALDVRLVIAGAPDPRYPDVPRLAGQLGLDAAVTWTGYLDDAALRRTYAEADLLVHPSRYEGFGLQVAEAMAAGLPVVCARAGSLPEVAGDAALLVDPDDMEGMSAAMRRVLDDPALAERLAAAGRRQAARFTWRRTAEDTLAVYERAAAGAGRNAP
jgi:glycosyltransferase involved in cell wall biosynthesis